MAYEILKKYYSKSDNLFHIIKRKDWYYEPEDCTFESFDTFYKALKKDLSNANLLEYDFENVDLSKYNLSNAKLSSRAMIKLGTYTNKYFKILKADEPLSKITPSESKELVPFRQLELYNKSSEDDDLTICYISDLHLNHKLINKFKEYVNLDEIVECFKDIIKSLKASVPEYQFNRKIIFIGDISFNYKFFKLFFKIYRQYIPWKTFVILGNHDLWDKDLIKKSGSLENMIVEIRKFLIELENPIYLLQNDIYFPNGTKKIYSENEILNLSNEELRKIFVNNGYGIFGGIGFAGLNENFNYNHGIYRDAPLNREKEIQYSKQIEELHEKLKLVASDKKIYFSTHMPMSDWLSKPHVPKWTYLSGHTHKNTYSEEESLTMYADNQIGYHNSLMSFKYISGSSNFNIFIDYADGIHEISKNEYISFYYGIGIRIDFNRQFCNLYMLKKSGTFCFLIRIKENGDLKLLNGGSIKNVGNHDLQYFYDNLDNYSQSVKLFLNSYSEYQKKVSKEIKSIGGSGYIHGCIIDIDFYNHIYINPLDGTITPYSAESMVEKHVYNNTISLLKYECKDLYKNYKFLTSNKNNKKLELAVINNDLIESSETVFVPQTDIYRVSRIIKSFQYTTKYNIVRLWNDTIACNATKECGKEIITGFIEPNRMIEARKKIKAEKNNSNNIKKTIPKKKKEINTLSIQEKNRQKHIDKINQLSNNTMQVNIYNGAKVPAEYECLLCHTKYKIRPDHFIGYCKKCKSKKLI